MPPHYSDIDPHGTASTVKARAEALDDVLSLVLTEVSKFIKESISSGSKDHVNSLLDNWTAELRKTFGLDGVSHHNSFLTSRKMYLLLRDRLVDIGRDAQHNRHSIFEIKREGVQIWPQYSVHNIVLELTSIITREDWSKQVRLRFVEVLLRGMENGLDEEMLDNWRDSAKRDLLQGFSAGTSLTTGSERLSLSKATKVEEYRRLSLELSTFLDKIKHSKNTLLQRGSSSLIEYWQPSEIQKRIEEAHQVESSSHLSHSLAVFTPSRRYTESPSLFD